MNPSDFKKIARLLKDLYVELKQEILNAGVDLYSDEYDVLYKKGQEVVREKLLSDMGFTLDEYREAKALVEASKSESSLVLDEIKNGIDEVRSKRILSEDEVKSISSEIAKSEVKPPQIIHQIVKETIVEKPTIVEKTMRVEYNDTELKESLKELDKRIKTMPSEDKIKQELTKAFSERLQKNIDIMGMPDFRKLAMGLQQQIDEVRSSSGQQGTTVSVVDVSGTIDGSNDTFTIPTTPTTGVMLLLLARQPQAETIDFTISGTTITYTTPPAEDLSGQPHIAILY